MLGSPGRFVESVGARSVDRYCSRHLEGATAPFDYQLGGGYTRPEGTEIVVRDSTDKPEPGLYNICYLNGFQSQPGESESWGDLVLTRDGEPVSDPGWQEESLLDTAYSGKREPVANRLGKTIQQCAEDGFDAVEFDNLDSYLRSGGLLTATDNFALAELLAARAVRRPRVAEEHGRGIRAGQNDRLRLRDRRGVRGVERVRRLRRGLPRDYYDTVLSIE